MFDPDAGMARKEAARQLSISIRGLDYIPAAKELELRRYPLSEVFLGCPDQLVAHQQRAVKK